MLKNIKALLPIILMLLGGIIGDYAKGLTPLIPYIISAMLFMTFLSVRPQDITWKRSHLYLLGMHVIICLAGYVVTYPLGQELQNATLICLMMPAATAGPVMVQALGGQAGYTIGYVLLSHLVIVLVAPSVFPYLEQDIYIDFWLTAKSVFYQVFGLVVPAILLAWGIRYTYLKLALRLAKRSDINIGLWYLSLILLMAHIVSTTHIEDVVRFVPSIAMGLICCLAQFGLGQMIGCKLKTNVIATRHALGHKNTTLGIWLASMYLSPETAISAASYVVWQNILISYLLARHRS